MFTPQAIQTFYQTLPIMLKGMGGIFIILGAIYVLLAISNRVFANRKKNGEG